MDWLETSGMLILGILVRLVIPIGVTGLLVWFFRKLDQRWQAEAGISQEVAVPKNPGCWDINNCPAELRAECRAFAHPDKPCWLVLRNTDGLMQEKCLGCDVFREAPVPVLA